MKAPINPLFGRNMSVCPYHPSAAGESGYITLADTRKFHITVIPDSAVLSG